MKKLDVPYIDQTGGGAFTGCESVTAVMLLQYLGYDMTIYEFIDDHLDREPFEMRDGILYGGDPRKVFVGDPYDRESMGCYAPVIKRSLERILGEEYEVIDETGGSLPELAKRYIENGMPLIVWATIDMKEMIPGPSWRLIDTGEEYEWRSNEHCLLLTGYDNENYIFNDPWNNNGVIAYDRQLTEKRYREQYSQAIGVRPVRTDD